MIKWYIIVASHNKDKGSEIYLISATSGNQAHEFAISEYRKSYNLQPNIHVQTNTLSTEDTEEDGKRFMERLVEEMSKPKHAWH